MSLDRWQEQIHEHFKVLHEFRKETPNNNPVYALEHGLNASELDRLKADIRAHIASREPFDRHWLPWVVYAAEVGYTYDGQEYWPTFESSTIGWTRFGGRYRSWIRECFITFRDAFNGAAPTGPWAEWFKNICWPIRHAILPHDLQHQLAKALFDMRLFFRGELFESPPMLGNFIATHCRTGSKRFFDLLEDPVLVGQISVALLLQGQEISEELLLKETKARIVADLGKEQLEREWLESAQRQAATTYEGLRRRAASAVGIGPRDQIPIPAEDRLKIENTPRLFLYPRSNAKEWGVKLELQDLRSLAARIRHLGPIIAGNYCTVAGTSGAPQPRGMFLRPGPHPFALVRWPSSTEVLVSFENAPADLNAFLRMDQLIPPGNVHLFKISTENIGYEIHGKHVRPGQIYVVVSISPIRHDGMILKPFNLRCEGVYSALIETPQDITSCFEEVVKAVGLSCAKSLRAWPVGLPAKEWDEQGYGVWLAGDRIRVAVRADYELRGVQVSINRDIPSFLDVPASSGEPVLLDLSFLPFGENLIEIKAVAKQQPHEDLVGYMSAIVREPQAWDVKTANQGALRGFVDPEIPSLEEIWANDVNIEIFGPAGRSIGCRFRLFDKTGTSVVGEKQIAGMTLPVYGQHWRNEFTAKVKKDTSMQEAYDVAHVGELFFDGEEIGYYTVAGERKSTPIRWAVHKCGHHKRLRYINESEDERVAISQYEFTAPDNLLAIEKIGTGQTVEYADGGLFVITGGDGFGDSIVMSPHGRRMGLKDMRISPRLRNTYEREEGVRKLVALYDLWGRSRTSGNILSDLWRKQVLKCLTSRVCSVVGGKRWEEAERAYLEKNDEACLRRLKVCISDKADERYIGAVLERDAERLSGISMSEREAFLGRLFAPHIRSLDTKYGVDRSGEGGIVIRVAKANLLPGFVLRLSSAPNTVLSWEKEEFPVLLEYLLEFPVIARAGRFLVLAVERHCAATRNQNGCCHKGWKWQ